MGQIQIQYSAAVDRVSLYSGFMVWQGLAALAYGRHLPDPEVPSTPMAGDGLTPDPGILLFARPGGILVKSSVVAD